MSRCGECRPSATNMRRSSSTVCPAWVAWVAWVTWVAWAPARASLLPLEAERLRASVGGYAVMNCHLDFPFGNEIPYHLQWDKDGETIFSWYSGSGSEQARVADRWGGRVRRLGSGRLGLGRGSLNVSAVRETDAGLYRCRVAFPNRTPPERNNGTFYYLEVDGGNVIATPPTNVTVLEGERAEFECQPKEPEASVEWYKDGEVLERLPELAARVQLAANGSLVLRSAASGDAGEYSCRVRAAQDRTQSAAAYLDVQYKAKVVYSPEERYLPFGKPASLDCHFSANPPLTNLRWEKDGFLFDPYNVPGVFYSRNGSLLFNKVDESHEGQYSCTAYNALGSAGASAGVRVRVLRPPALVARPRGLYVARRGASLTLPCAAAAAPPAPEPAVHWTRKDGSPLPDGRHSVEGGNLTISEVSEEDRGVYVCVVSNEAASLRLEAELLVENVPPRAPLDLVARAGADRVHLAWRPAPAALGADYTVWYRERAVSEWRTMKILSRGVTDATLVGLRPATEYEVRVLSQDHIGDGLFSKPIFVWTLDPDASSDSATTYAAPETETAAAEAAEAAAAEAASATDSTPADDEDGELEVSVRLLDEGALVRWRRPEGAVGRCSVRWLEGGRPLTVAHTHHDYLLVGGEWLREGGEYVARVQCAGGTAGGASLRVPQYARLRGVAGGCAAAALLLAAAAAGVYLARRRLWPRPQAPPRAPAKRGLR